MTRLFTRNVNMLWQVRVTQGLEVSEWCPTSGLEIKALEDFPNSSDQHEQAEFLRC